MNLNWLNSMNKFDLHLESTGSMHVYKNNTYTVIGNLVAHRIQLESDWRVALAENFFPTSIMNVMATSYFIYTHSSQIKFPGNVTGGVQVSREDFTDNATFPAGD